MPKSLCSVGAIHKNKADETIFILESSGYYVFIQDKESGEEELHGPHAYSEINGIPAPAQSFMGFQPSMDKDVYLLLTGNMVFFRFMYLLRDLAPP